MAGAKIKLRDFFGLLLPPGGRKVAAVAVEVEADQVEAVDQPQELKDLLKITTKAFFSLKTFFIFYLPTEKLKYEKNFGEKKTQSKKNCNASTIRLYIDHIT